MDATEVEVATDTAALIDLAGRTRFDLFIVDADAAADPAGPAAGGAVAAVRAVVARLRAAEATAAAAHTLGVGGDDSCGAAQRPAPLMGIASRPADHAGLLTAGFCSVLAKPLTRGALQAAVRAVLAPTSAGSSSEAPHGGAAEGSAVEGGHGEGGTAALAGPAAVRILIVEGEPTPGPQLP